MRKSIVNLSISTTVLLLLAGAVRAQNLDTVATEFKPSGRVWGYAFGDYAWKGSNDEKGRGGSNQYTKVPLNANLFQWRRIYLGYDYSLSKKFSTEFLLAAEGNWAEGVVPGTGDVLTNNK